jgi:DNA-binding protein H-NS
MDLSALSFSELRDLQQQIPQEIKRREAEEKANVINEVRAFVKARGYALEDLVGKEVKVKQPVAAGSKVKVKYRHPQDLSLAWTGRGRTPKWVESWKANGGSLESLLV